MTESEAKYIEHLENEIKKLKEQNSSQLSMYEMTTIYLKKLQEDLKISEQKLLQTNKNLTDSINYASRIQNAFILQTNNLQKLFPKSFIFQKPKNIVSGDFIWAFDNEQNVFLGVGDCTGHGVPGAMLSIFVISMLNQIISDDATLSPAEILQKLDILMKKYLTKYDETIKDSVEISIIKYNIHQQELIFCGAKRPLVQISDNEIIVHNGNKYYLGNSERSLEKLENKNIELKKDNVIYMFSDGFQDQFGGNKNSKFSLKRLLNLLLEISSLDEEEQLLKSSDTYEKWKGNINQIDDVILLGIRI